ncbi:MAG: sugar transferase [Lachnospiraceae bacterium]|nr:sugar transferase [Lachnospiraceae bacterium]
MSNFSQKEKIIQNYSILGVECVCIVLSYVLAILTRGVSASYSLYSEDYLSTILCILFFHLLAHYLFDWNAAFFKRGYYVELVAVLKYNCILALTLGFFLFATRFEDFSRLVLFYFFIYNVCLTYLGHLLLKKFFTSVYRNSNNSNKLLVLCTSGAAENIINRIGLSPEWSFQITGIILLDVNQTGQRIQGIPVLSDREHLYEYMKTALVDEVFIHLPDYSNQELESMITAFQSMGITVHVNLDIFSDILAHKTAESFAGFTVLSYESTTFDYRRLLIKRIMDILGALVGLLITALLTPFIALAIKLDSPGPVFFSQKRVGKNGRYFKLYKFRSMYVDAERRKQELMAENQMDGPIFKLEHDPRITKTGAFLRKTSLDELPQFFNILLGQMSLVGTRPPTIEEFQQYELYYRRRLSIKPGLTGLWQVSGRSEISDFREIVKLDLEYIDHWSLTSDIRILLMTVWVVVMGKGAR